MRRILASSVAVFTLTLFASATLLFLIEPMIAKMILPKFGGTPAVWNTCMVFFQAALLAGYAYAHAVTSWLPPRRQTVIQLILLALPFLLLILPIRVQEDWAPKAEDYPVVWLLWLLVMTVGLPFFIISTSAPLLSKWFADTGDPAARDPYFLYAASNVGSMVSLFGYPLLVEPVFSLKWQSWLWTVGYLSLVAMTAWCASRVWRATALAPALVPVGGGTVETEEAVEEEETGKVSVAVKKKKKKKRRKDDAEAFTRTPAERIAPPADEITPLAAPDLEAGTRPSLWRYVYWIALAFVPSSMMLAVTTYLTTDIASIPLLWVIPLGLYLLSFILVFTKFDGMLDWIARSFALEDYKVSNPFLPGFFGTMFWRGRRFGLHQFMILALPVAVLLLVFVMVSDIRIRWIGWLFLLHLSALFIVSMVCHGELARTRPATQYLTGFYLCMSFGGVIGGMFNALAAPIIFSSVAEYPIVLVVACLLLPPLETGATSRVNFWIDIGLAAALGIGAIYATVRFFASDAAALQTWEEQAGAPGLHTALAVGAVVLALIAYAALSKTDRLGHWLDVGLPVALAILSAQLFFRTPFKQWDMTKDVGEAFAITKQDMMTVLTFGLPVALCYGFAERPLRFGLGVGAIFLAGAVNSGIHKESDLGLYREYTFYGHLLGDHEFPRSDEGRLQPVTMTLHQERSFFGVLKVEQRVPGNHVRLLHGTTLHGEQLRLSTFSEMGSILAPLGASNPLDLLAPYAHQEKLRETRNEALTYYHRTGPIGQVYSSHCPPGSKYNVAFIGLGTGTMASYLEPGQHGDIYEIDAAVVRLAEDPQYFTYLRDCKANEPGKPGYTIKLGDARLKMRDAPDHSYRLIVVDAFSSDAIPVHLITKEAVELYFQKLAPDGILAIHISNRHLRLGPVLARIGQELGKTVMGEYDNGDDIPWQYTPGKNTSDWVVLANNPAVLAGLIKQDDERVARWAEEYKRWKEVNNPPDERYSKAPRWQTLDPKAGQKLWTDDFSDIVGVLRWFD